MKRATLSLILLAAAVVTVTATAPVSAGGPLGVCNPGQPFLWPGGGAGIVYNPDPGPFLGIPDPRIIMRTAFDQWENVPTSSISYVQGADLAADITGANLGSVFLVIDGLSPIILDDDGTVAAALNFPPGVLGLAGLEVINTVTCDVVEGLAIIFSSVSTPTGYLDVATHEFGHFSNLAHTVVNGQIYLASVGGDNTGPTPNDTFGAAPNPFANDVIETMYPFYFGGTVSSSTLHPDDVAIISTLYPEPGFPAAGTSISGTIFAPDGFTRLTGANVIARNVANPFFDAVSAISSDFTNSTTNQSDPNVGVYTINGLTPGADYAVYVDQILAGGFSTPPLSPLPGPEEFHDANEANSNPPDDPSVFTAVQGGATGVDVIFNEPQPGAPLPVGDDGFVELSLGFEFEICGQSFTSVFVNANGNLTFGTGDAAFIDSVNGMLAGPPRIAAVWDDLSPFNFFTGAQQGLVTFDRTANDFKVIFRDVPEFLDTGANSFDITLKRSSDHVDVDYFDLTVTDGLAGVSCGGFVASGLEPAEDLSASAPSRLNFNNFPARYEQYSFGNPNDLANSTLRYTGGTDYNDNWAESNDNLGDARKVQVPFDTVPVWKFSEIEPAGADVDYYRFSAEGGTTLVAEVIAGHLDSLIGVFDVATGTLLDFDDDAGAGLLSRLVFAIPADGEYALAVTTFPDFDFDGDGGSGGRYVLDAQSVDGTLLVLGDDNAVNVGLGFSFPFQGSSYSDVFVNANGNLTFGTADTAFNNWTENVPGFLNGPPRIAALWDDLSPNAGGLVIFDGDASSATVSFVDVPEFISTGSNSFTITLDASGDYSIAYGGVTALDGLVGTTPGGGAVDPMETDLSASGPFSRAGTTYELFTGGGDPFDLDGTTQVFDQP